MNLEQIIFIKRPILCNSTELHTGIPEVGSVLYASQTDSAGGKASNSGKQEDTASQASDNKRAKQDNTSQAEAGNEDVSNKANDQREDASITQPDTNLTGDTGNLDIGQTDLGASGTGAEDI